MKYIIILACLISLNAYAEEAKWTGNFDLMSKSAFVGTWDCEYEINGEKFWRLQEGYCAKTIEVKMRKD